MSTAGNADPTVQFGRFVLTNRPQMSPGNCGVCGYAGADRAYVDLRLDFEFYGSLYLCANCVADAAHLFGLASAGEYATLVEKNESLTAEVKHLSTQLSEAEQTIDLLSIRLANRTIVDSKSQHGNHVPAAQDAKAASPGKYPDANGTVKGLPQAQRKSDAQVNRARSHDTSDPDTNRALGL